MSLRKILLGTTFLSLMLGFHLPFASADDGVVDNTTCTVLNDSDSADSFNSLRRKIEQGFNRPEQRSCTELVNFKEPSNGEIRIKLTAPLHINNENDVDCSAE